jgi:hypothetical protein
MVSKIFYMIVSAERKQKRKAVLETRGRRRGRIGNMRVTSRGVVGRER